MGVVDRGVVEGLVEFDTKPETGMSLDFEFLILALNLLSMVGGVDGSTSVRELEP